MDWVQWYVVIVFAFSLYGIGKMAGAGKSAAAVGGCAILILACPVVGRVFGWW